MVRPHSFDGMLDKASAALDDAINSANAAVATLAGHARGEGRSGAINFPMEEVLVREAVELLERWKSLASSLVKELDRATQEADLQHRRLFDEKIGLEDASLLGRKLARGPSKPQTIITELEVVLDVSAELDLLFKQARPALSRCFHDCERHLEGVIEHRRKLDFDIEEVQRRANVLTEKLMYQRRNRPSSRHADLQSGLEADYGDLLAEQDDIRRQEAGLQSRRTAGQRLIDIYEGLAASLNVQVAAVSAMAAKSAVDIEQRIALLKALASNANSHTPEAARTAAVEDLIRAFEANILAGQDLAARKAHVDAVFKRRLEPHLPPVSEDAGETAGDAQPEG
ncbi:MULTISPECIES: hypothetical protein [Rhizobium]|uniref:Uncharacterized protein n=1 Tax=Rhizobium tropici TaxID=398 RepID=A0A329YMP1_RHITR|nr:MULTISPECIES: hypothetical protein [Rhizobium]MBB3287739.1 hypothetical protein [Rhizobium sp. BK252]MBB3402657.1 hypothetical protein [Rhizobium sp. BK289]MBB3415233.1 hypothetical protein [Rhizobium sp. BK284]MBB3483122.1 hypothetical protein [Rhizobium sp. BK347]MDK4720746.1 hypothetical protein [Rhizobium sp. CNPSo 3968]